MVDTSVIGSVTWGFESGVSGTCPQFGSQKISVPSPVRRISSLRRGLVADNERDLLLLWLPSSHSSVVETYIPTYVLWIMAGTRLCMALVHAIQVVALVGVALWMGLFGGGGCGGGDLVRHWFWLWRDQQQSQQEPLNQSGRIHHPQEWNPRTIQTEFETDHLPRLVVSVPPTSDPDWKAFFASKQSMILVQEERSLADPKAWEFLCHDYHQEPQDEEEERVAFDQGMEYVHDYTAADADLYLVPCPPPVWSRSGPKLIQDATTGTLFLLVPSSSSSSLSGRQKQVQQQVVHSHLFPMEEEEDEGHATTATATTLSIPTCLEPVVQLHWLVLDRQHQPKEQEEESWSILWNGWWPAMTRAQQSVSFLSWNGWVPWSVEPATTTDQTPPRGPAMAPFEIHTMGPEDGTNHEENLESLRIHWTPPTTHSTSTSSQPQEQPQPRLFRSTIETWLSQQNHGSTTNTIPVYLLVQPDSYQSHPLQVVDNDQEDTMDESLKEDATTTTNVTLEKEDRVLLEDSEATDENKDKKNVQDDNGINEQKSNDKDKEKPDGNESNKDSYATSATVLLSDDSLFIVLPPHVQDGIAQDVVRRISSWITRRCLGLSQFPGELMDDDDENDQDQDSSFVMNVEWMQYPSFESMEDWMHVTPNHHQQQREALVSPSWFYNLFWRRALSELHRHAVEEADQALQRYKALEKQQQEQEEIVQQQQTDDLSSALTSVWKVLQEWTGWQPPLPQALSWPVERAQRRLFQAEQALRLQHDYALAAQILLGHDDDEDNHHDKDLPPPQTNPVVLTQLVLDLGWEQYAALLAPLLIPLVLPALLGVGKELSRYWKKRNAKKTKQKQSATTQ